MADNITLNPGSGGEVVAADEVSGRKYQIIKIALGGNGIASDISSGSPFPVQLINSSVSITNTPNVSVTNTPNINISTFTGVTVSTPLPIETHFGNDSSIDSIGRLRVAIPSIRFYSELQYDKQPLFWDETVTGAGASSTHVPNESSVNMTIGTVSGEVVVRQTKPYFRRQPLILMSGVMGALKPSVRQRIGRFDAENGVFFEQNGADFRVVNRSFVTGSAVDTAFRVQANWNLDTMDGNGSSGVSLNMTRTQTFVIDLRWGAGRVRCGFVINGEIIYCHQFLHANTLTVPFATTSNLPCRYEISNTGTAASSTVMKQMSTTVKDESNGEIMGVSRYVSRANSTLNIDSTLTPLVSVRLKNGYIRGKIKPIGIDVNADSVTDMEWKIILNGNLSGASFNSVGTNAASEFDTSATSISNGEELSGGYLNQRITSVGNIKTDLDAVANIAGTADIITLAVRTRTGTTNAIAALRYREII